MDGRCVDWDGGVECKGWGANGGQVEVTIYIGQGLMAKNRRGTMPSYRVMVGLTSRE